MSFKYILLFFLFFSFGCGVKGDPIVPQDTILPSVDSKYLVKPEEDKKEETNKEKETNE